MWKIVFNRFLDAAELEEEDRDRIMQIEDVIFKNIQKEVEHDTGNDWSGTKDENYRADFKIAKSVKSSFESYEKSKQKNDPSFFRFTKK